MDAGAPPVWGPVPEPVGRWEGRGHMAHPCMTGGSSLQTAAPSLSNPETGCGSENDVQDLGGRRGVSGRAAGTLPLPRTFFTDLCHPGLGPQEALALLPGDEHRHVGAPHHSAAGGPAQGLRLRGDPLCGQEAGVWRPRWAFGQAHSPSSWPRVTSGFRPGYCDLRQIHSPLSLASHLEDRHHSSSSQSC